MSTDESIDREMERTLRDYYAARSRELQAPADTWARLERRLDRPRRFDWFASHMWKLLTAGAGTVAAAALVVLVFTLVSQPSVSEELGPLSDQSQPPAIASLPGNPGIPGPQSQPGPEAPLVVAAADAQASQPQAVAAAAQAVAQPTAAPPAAQPAAPAPAPTVIAAVRATPRRRTHRGPCAHRRQAGRGAHARSCGHAGTAGHRGRTGRSGVFRRHVHHPRLAAGRRHARARHGLTVSLRAAARTRPASRRPPPSPTSCVSPPCSPRRTPCRPFSLDVDRTSYFLALNWAREGYQVDPASVRAEEWINAFDYGYPPPSDEQGFGVQTDIVAHPLDDGKLLARIGFQAPHLPDDRPLNVTLVLDASGFDGGREPRRHPRAPPPRPSARACAPKTASRLSTSPRTSSAS